MVYYGSRNARVARMEVSRFDVPGSQNALGGNNLVATSGSGGSNSGEESAGRQVRLEIRGGEGFVRILSSPSFRVSLGKNGLEGMG